MTSIKKNYFYNVIYQILSIIIPFLTMPYISRVLGVNKLGEYAYSYAVSSFFLMFAMLGVGKYGNRLIAENAFDIKEKSKAFWSLQCLRAFITILVFFIYVLYVVLLSEDKIMSSIWSFYVFSSFFDISWLFFGMEKFKITVIRNSVCKVIMFLCTFLIIKTEQDVYTYCAIISLGQIISQLTLWPFLKQEVKCVKVSLSDVVKHIKPCFILFIPVIAVSIYKYMDKLMLGSYVNYSEVGLYENASKINELPIVFVMTLGNVMLPRITKLLAQGRKREVENYFYKSIIFAAFLSSALCFGLIGIMQELIPLYLGPGYERCMNILLFLLPSSVFVALANVVRTQILIPSKMDKIYIISVLIGGGCNLLVNLLLIPRYGAIGAAIGTLIAEMVVCIYQMEKVRLLTNIKSMIIAIIPFFAIGFFMAGGLLFISFDDSIVLNMIAKIIIGSLFYILLSYIYYLKKLKVFLLMKGNA